MQINPEALLIVPVVKIICALIVIKLVIANAIMVVYSNIVRNVITGSLIVYVKMIKDLAQIVALVMVDADVLNAQFVADISAFATILHHLLH